jgi:hypothetical protein
VDPTFQTVCFEDEQGWDSPKGEYLTQMRAMDGHPRSTVATILLISHFSVESNNINRRDSILSVYWCKCEVN